MKNLISLLFLYLLLLPITFAQVGHSTCGTEVSPQFYNLLRQQAMASSISNAKLQMTTCTLTLQPHIVRTSNGTGGLSSSDLNNSIQQLNQAYLQVGFHFIVSPTNYINNDTYYNLLQAASANEFNMANPNIDPTMVNVFFAPNAGFVSGGQLFPSNWTSLPQNTVNRNWIIMNNSFATDGETLPHEVGHYFNLMHTHRDDIVERVTRDVTDNCYNADTAGDLVIDTPADHDLATWNAYQIYNIDANCNYIANENDNCLPTLPYTPDTRNIMSYAYIDAVSIGCRIDFSQGQVARMVDCLNNLRPDLNTSCSGGGSTCNVSASPSTVSAASGGGNYATQITTVNPNDPWNVSASSWISLNTTAGIGSGTLIITVSPNNGPARTGMVVVSCGGTWPGPGPAPSTTITVTQAAGSALCNVTALPSSVPASSSGGNYSSQITTANSVDPWVVSKLATWITLNTTSGTGSGPVSFTVAPNTGPARTATITVSCDILVVSPQIAPFTTITVTQAATTACYVTASPATVNAPASGGYGYSNISPAASGGSWAASTPASWVSLDVTSGSGNSFLGFNIAPNCGPARTTTIEVRCGVVFGGQMSFPNYITVTQAAGSPNINSGLQTTNADCQTLGSASVNPTGGQTPYTIDWSTGSTSTSVNGLPFDNYVVTITDNYGCEIVDQFSIDDPATSIQLKVLLEGAYNPYSYQMNDYLRVGGLLPSTDPYGIGAVVDPVVFDAAGQDAIVDWILIELKNSVTLATETQYALLLQKDGDVVDLDGISTPRVCGDYQSYYLVVNHRTHLPIMTSGAVLILPSVGLVHDFTSTVAYGGPNATKIVGGNYMLWTGDTNSDKQIDSADRSNAWNERNTSGYLNVDCTLEGNSDAMDRSLIWNYRNKVSYVP